MLATPALGGVILAFRTIGHADLHGWTRWLILAMLAGPAVFAQARYTARPHGDRWISALIFLIAGTALMIAIAWAVGLITALATVAGWMFLQDPGLMNQVVSAITVATPLITFMIYGWRRMGTYSTPRLK